MKHNKLVQATKLALFSTPLAMIELMNPAYAGCDSTGTDTYVCSGTSSSTIRLDACVKKLYENNNDKLLKNNEYTKVVIQQCGKRRLAIVSKILDISREKQ